MIARFRLVAYAEAATFLILLACVVVKRVFHGPDLVQVMGPIHGVLFLVYLVMVLQIRASQGWALGRTILVFVASALPFGGFFVGSHLREDNAPATR
jgi:integral membrane protein